jgi:hypothetical protein
VLQTLAVLVLSSGRWTLVATHEGSAPDVRMTVASSTVNTISPPGALVARARAAVIDVRSESMRNDARLVAREDSR